VVMTTFAHGALPARFGDLTELPLFWEGIGGSKDQPMLPNGLPDLPSAVSNL